jgi:dTDP-glucose pyrophosphorylase/CBS domain-containing protein
MVLKKKKKIKTAELLISPNASIKEALEVLSKTPYQIIFTSEDNKRVISCITDGDIRRAFLSGHNLDSIVEKIGRKNFISATSASSSAEMMALLRKNGIRQLPILDKSGELLDVVVLEDLLEPSEFDYPVVIMAGGRGSRLMPFTETMPKPLLQIGDKPIIEHLISNLSQKGVKNFFVSVNYLAEKIMDHLGDGSKFNAKIEYINETKPLGTAGPLSLLRNKLDRDFMVFNGDVLAPIDLNLFAKFHQEHESIATVCAKIFTTKVPYGVLRTEENKLLRIEEKPEISFTVSSGIYFFSKQIFSFLNADEPMDMPQLLEAVIKSGKPVHCFQSAEPWIDVGSPTDFERAQKYLKYLAW